MGIDGASILAIQLDIASHVKHDKHREAFPLKSAGDPDKTCTYTREEGFCPYVNTLKEPLFFDYYCHSAVQGYGLKCRAAANWSLYTNKVCFAVQSTGVGKTLAKLRKSGPEELRTLADNLVKKWKTSVNQVPAPDNSESAKRLRQVSEHHVL